MMRHGLPWIRCAIAALLLSLVVVPIAPAMAKGVVGLQAWGAGGYHRSFPLEDNALELRAALDLKLAFVLLGIQGRFGDGLMDGEGVRRGVVYFDVTLQIPLPVVVPYLRAGVGVATISPIAPTGFGRGDPLLAVHQGIGVDFLIPENLALGVLVDVDENVDTEGRRTEVGLSGLFVVKFRI